jgi:hypothetical protein
MTALICFDARFQRKVVPKSSTQNSVSSFLYIQPARRLKLPELFCSQCKFITATNVYITQTKYNLLHWNRTQFVLYTVFLVMCVWKMQFLFNVLNLIRVISINSTHLNANCLLADQERQEGEVVYCVRGGGRIQGKNGKSGWMNFTLCDFVFGTHTNQGNLYIYISNLVQISVSS